MRDSKIVSTVRTPGAQGAVILAIETTAAVLGSASQGQTTITLVRVTEAAWPSLRITQYTKRSWSHFM